MDEPIQDSADIFVSYRSYDVEAVRTLVERLLASGISLWFAEYRIRLRNRDTFHEQFLQGVQGANRAIVFTSQRYFESEHCEEELRNVANRGIPFLEVRVVPYDATSIPKEKQELLELLKNRVARIDLDNDPDRAMRFIADQFSLDVDRKDSTPLRRRVLPFGYGLVDRFALDLGDFDLGRRTSSPDETALIQATVEASQDLGSCSMNWALAAGPMPAAPVVLSVNDEKRLFEELCQYANDYLGVLNTGVCAGAHLVGGRHFAVSYSLGFPNCWSRKYAIEVGASRGRRIEFVFTFHVLGTFEDFCRHTRLMDRVVSSLKWKPGLSDLVSTGCVVTAAAATAIAVGVTAWVYQTLPPAIGLRFPIAALIGITASVISTLCLRKLINWVGKSHRAS